jgi:hypothetical protein
MTTVRARGEYKCSLTEVDSFLLQVLWGGIAVVMGTRTYTRSTGV